MSVTHGGVIVGNVSIKFEPRNSLFDFINETSKISLIRKLKGFPAAKNMAIRGENLATLAALKAGAGISGESVGVDVIYIDPPYNVGGNQGYNNKWKGESEKERDWAKDHGKFLDFMEPRLKIGRSLLTEEGVIFVSICDGEYCRLKILMDEIFGESNCLGTIIWDQGRGSAAKHIAKVHEYILVYAKNASICPSLKEEKASASPIIDKANELKERGISYKDAQKEFNVWLKQAKLDGVVAKNESSYRLHPDSFRPFQTTASCAQDNPNSRSHKKLKHPKTGKYAKVPAKGWKWAESTLMGMYRPEEAVHGDGFSIAGKLCFGKDETSVPRKVQYIDEKQDQMLTSMIGGISHSQGKADLPSGISFTTPKPISLIKRLIKSYPKKDVVVLDYFAGSGATACAVNELNQEDGGNRRWIMVEEMKSTFNLIMMKRFEYAFPGTYGIYDLQTATVEDKELMKVFSKYSKDFIASYHFLNTGNSAMEQGMAVIGLDESSQCIVAITNPRDRKGKFFEKELKLLKEKIKEANAKKVLIYTINEGDSQDEPWRGIDKSIFQGTSCKAFKVIEIPDQLVKEWKEVLTAMAA